MRSSDAGLGANTTSASETSQHRPGNDANEKRIVAGEECDGEGNYYVEGPLSKAPIMTLGSSVDELPALAEDVSVLPPAAAEAIVGKSGEGVEEAARRLFGSVVNDPPVVKVFHVDSSGKWQDSGTGLLNVKRELGGGSVGRFSMIVIGEDGHSELLNEAISTGRKYTIQKGAVIVWETLEDPEDVMKSLSFEDPDACTSFFTDISEYQKYAQILELSLPPIDEDNVGTIAGHMCLIQLQHLVDLAHRFLELDNLDKVNLLFQKCEEKHSTLKLQYFYVIFKSLVLLSNTEAIKILVSEKYYLLLFGSLEYDPLVPEEFHISHREWLRSKATFKRVLPTLSDGISTVIHSTFRLHYLRDVCLARVIDEATFNVLTAMMNVNYIEIAHFIAEDEALQRTTIKELLLSQPGSSHRIDLLNFLQELFEVSKRLDVSERLSIMKTLCESGLLTATTEILGDTHSRCRLLGFEILSGVIAFCPEQLHHHIIHDPGIDKAKGTLLYSIVKCLLYDKDYGVVCFAAEILAAASNPDIMSQYQSEFLDFFYSGAVPWIALPFYDPESIWRNTLVQENLFMKGFEQTTPEFGDGSREVICDLLSFFSVRHKQRALRFLLERDVLVRVVELVKSPERHLAVGAVKFLRNIINVRETEYIDYILSRKLLSPLLDMLCSSFPKDNLVNSLILELLSFCVKEKLSPLIVSMVEQHEAWLRAHRYLYPIGALVEEYDSLTTKSPAKECAEVQNPDESSALGKRPPLTEPAVDTQQPSHTKRSRCE
ncbi:Serine threonine-phosphatase 4 regulatory subunit 3 [Pelomyxa schiedti]|nr:Serine threonine-phosphatase 4 regulatory subunit 3 [Pelomyxa schiedti]